MISITIEMNILFIAALAAASFAAGYLIRAAQLRKRARRVLELEREMLQNHARILELEKEKVNLGAQLKAYSRQALMSET